MQCTAQQKASVLPYSLGVQIFEFIANYSTVAESGIVSMMNIIPAYFMLSLDLSLHRLDMSTSYVIMII